MQNSLILLVSEHAEIAFILKVQIRRRQELLTTFIESWSWRSCILNIPRIQNLYRLKKNLQRLIVKGKTGQAIRLLVEFVEQSEEYELREEVILLAARYEELMKNKHLGVSTDELYNVSIARINQTLLKIVERLPDDAEVREISKKQSSLSPKKWWRKVVGLSVIVGILAGVAECSGYSLRDLFQPRSSAQEDIDLTLFVHGPNGKMDRVKELEHQATVTIDFGNNTQLDEMVMDKGKVSFGGLPERLRDSTFMVRLEGAGDYLLTHSDSLYPYSNNSVYLEVYKTKKREKINSGEEKSKKEEVLKVKDESSDSGLTKLSGEKRTFMFRHAPMKNPKITLGAKYSEFQKVSSGDEFTKISLPVELSYIDSLKFIEGNDTCTFQGTLYESKNTYTAACN